MNAASCPRLKQTRETFAARLREPRWKIGEHDHTQWLRQLARLLIKLRDRGEFIAQKFLNDRLDIFREIRQLLLNVARLAPDALADKRLHFIGEMHEARETLTKANRIEEIETYLAWRNLREQAKRGALKKFDGFFAALQWRFHQQRWKIW